MKTLLPGIAIALTLALMATPSIASEPAMRAMWVYKTEPIMASAAEQETLFAFCEQRQITDLFWQVHFDHTDGTQLKNADLTRPFLRAAHDHALRIHTLGGDPAHTRTAKHERVLAMADALVRFNSAGERFDGMHLDIEPHGLPQWKTASDSEKSDLLTQFVDIHTQVAERLHAADPALAYGADIVFWLNKTKPDGSPAYPVTYRGVAADAARHLLNVVDNVAIMSYRDKTEGRNGIIALVENTIAYADTVKARAFVGVKMADIGPTNESFFGRSQADMMSALATVDDTYRDHPGYAGLAFFMYEAFRTMPPR